MIKTQRVKKYLILFLLLSLTNLIVKKLKQEFWNLKNEKDNVVYAVLTSEKTILTRGHAIWNTWARDSTDILFACNCENVLKYKKLKAMNEMIPPELTDYGRVIDLPILHLNITEDYEKMGKKVLLVLKLLHEEYSNKKKWFFLSDDDTYVFPENVNKFIKKNNHTAPLYYGFKFRHHARPNGYVGGGAGILFTLESMNRLANAINKSQCDRFLDKYGDVTIGICAKFVNVTVGNSNDENGKSRFNYDTPNIYYFGPIPEYFYMYGNHNRKIGKNCCSPETISFHHLKPKEMLEIYENKTFLKDFLS